MAIGDQRQQWQIWSDAGAIGDSCYCLQRLCRQLEPLLLEGFRAQPPSAEVARDEWADSLARSTTILRDTGVQTSNSFDALRVTSSLSGSCGNLGTEMPPLRKPNRRPP